MSFISVEHKGGCAFTASVRQYTIDADSPPGSDDCTDAGPTPPEIMVASLATCVGLYVTRYLRRAGIQHEGFTVDAAFQMAEDPHRIGSIAIDVNLPEDLPEGRKKAVLRVAEQCTIHSTLLHPPEISIEIK